MGKLKLIVCLFIFTVTSRWQNWQNFYCRMNYLMNYELMFYLGAVFILIVPIFTVPIRILLYRYSELGLVIGLEIERLHLWLWWLVNACCKVIRTTAGAL